MAISQNFPDVRPSLNLNFARSKTLDPRITFERASIGTYVDENGLIKTAAADEPRFDHNPETSESLGLLIEEQRTNIVTYSENFNLWGTYRTTISLNAAISPSGQLNAAKFNVTTDTGYHARSILVAGGTYAVSIFAKAGEYNGIQITGTNTIEDHACFNLVNGTAYHSGTNVTNRKIENFGNGWYRCSARLPLTNGFFFIAITDGITTSWLPPFTGSNASDGIYIWGAQVEAGSFPTSYIPTSGSQFTRQPDNAQITGTNFTDFYNATEGSIFWNGIPNQSNNGCQAYHFDDGTSNNRHFMRPDSGNPTISYTSSGVSGASSVPAFGSKIAYAYKSNNYGASQDGLLYSIPSLSSVPSGLIQLGIGYRADNNNSHMNGHIKQLLYYPERLTNAQLQNLTK